jgi:hypothetical protein
MEMSTEPAKKSAGIIVSWSVSLVLLIVLAVVGYKFRDAAMRLEDVVGNKARQNQVLAQMKSNLLTSVEAEKNAVLSDSDEDSEVFAAQSLKAAAEIERGRIQFGQLVAGAGDEGELKLLQDFDRCWADFQKTQQEVLALAVRNSNLKAARLSQTKAYEAVQRFDLALSKLIEAGVSSGNCEQMVGPVFNAQRAGLRILYLHTLHIWEARDQEMDRLEAEMRSNSETVIRSLNTLTDLAGETGRVSLQDARKAYADFLEVTQEVLRLSRQNTNIKSMELTLGKGRAITAQCGGILTSLHEAVQNKTFKATR